MSFVRLASVALAGTSRRIAFVPNRAATLKETRSDSGVFDVAGGVASCATDALGVGLSAGSGNKAPRMASTTRLAPRCASASVAK